MNSSEALKGFISFLILSGIIGLSILSFRYIGDATNFISMASNSAVMPKYIEVTALTQNSATINWYTNNSLIGEIIYSENQTCFEDKRNNYPECNLMSEEVATKNHILTLTGLKPGTSYYYKIRGQNYLHPKDELLSFSTTKAAITEENRPTINDDEVSSGIEEQEVGFESETDFDGFAETSDEKVLGISTAAKVRAADKVSASIIEEFKEALVYNDLKYDFDQNGKVENADYSLFIQFITNPED